MADLTSQELHARYAQGQRDSWLADPSGLDLSESHLRGADFTGAHFAWRMSTRPTC